VYVGLETVLGANFKKHVLRSANLRENIIQVVIDEAHAISEWGGDNFQPNYAKLGELHGLLPPNIPFLAPTATCSNDTMNDITTKLCLSMNTLRIEFSNEKPNIALSVQTLQSPASSYGDLIPLIPELENAMSPADISQTLVYTNSHAETEDMQDIMHKHLILKLLRMGLGMALSKSYL
jgi:superfamily II DNA helicase RecQ